MTICTIDVHARDVVSDLIVQKVNKFAMICVSFFMFHLFICIYIYISIFIYLFLKTLIC